MFDLLIRSLTFIAIGMLARLVFNASKCTAIHDDATLHLPPNFSEKLDARDPAVDTAALPSASAPATPPLIVPPIAVHVGATSCGTSTPFVSLLKPNTHLLHPGPTVLYPNESLSGHRLYFEEKPRRTLGRKVPYVPCSSWARAIVWDLERRDRRDRFEACGLLGTRKHSSAVWEPSPLAAGGANTPVMRSILRVGLDDSRRSVAVHRAALPLPLVTVPKPAPPPKHSALMSLVAARNWARIHALKASKSVHLEAQTAIHTAILHLEPNTRKSEFGATVNPDSRTSLHFGSPYDRNRSTPSKVAKRREAAAKAQRVLDHEPLRFLQKLQNSLSTSRVDLVQTTAVSSLADVTEPGSCPCDLAVAIAPVSYSAVASTEPAWIGPAVREFELPVVGPVLTPVVEHKAYPRDLANESTLSSREPAPGSAPVILPSPYDFSSYTTPAVACAALPVAPSPPRAVAALATSSSPAPFVFSAPPVGPRIYKAAPRTKLPTAVAAAVAPSVGRLVTQATSTLAEPISSPRPPTVPKPAVHHASLKAIVQLPHASGPAPPQPRSADPETASSQSSSTPTPRVSRKLPKASTPTRTIAKTRSAFVEVLPESVASSSQSSKAFASGAPHTTPSNISRKTVFKDVVQLGSSPTVPTLSPGIVDEDVEMRPADAPEQRTMASAASAAQITMKWDSDADGGNVFTGTADQFVTAMWGATITTGSRRSKAVPFTSSSRERTYRSQRARSTPTFSSQAPDDASMSDLVLLLPESTDPPRRQRLKTQPDKNINDPVSTTPNTVKSPRHQQTRLMTIFDSEMSDPVLMTPNSIKAPRRHKTRLQSSKDTDMNDSVSATPNSVESPRHQKRLNTPSPPTPAQPPAAGDRNGVSVASPLTPPPKPAKRRQLSSQPSGSPSQVELRNLQAARLLIASTSLAPSAARASSNATSSESRGDVPLTPTRKRMKPLPHAPKLSITSTSISSDDLAANVAAFWAKNVEAEARAKAAAKVPASATRTKDGARMQV